MTVLIQAETGTGKELIARAIPEAGLIKAQPTPVGSGWGERVYCPTVWRQGKPSIPRFGWVEAIHRRSMAILRIA